MIDETLLGFPRSLLATSVVARALRHPELRSGDTVTVRYEYPPSPSGKAAMDRAADRGIRVEYAWPGAGSPWVARGRRA